MDEIRKLNLDDLPELMPEKAAAEFLYKSLTTMWRLRRQGQISFRRMGGVYYLREDIREYLDRIKFAAK